MSFNIIITDNLANNLDNITNIIEETFFRMHLKEMFDERYNQENENRTKEFNKYNFPENISKHFKKLHVSN
jgi:hypothetical protein